MLVPTLQMTGAALIVGGIASLFNGTAPMIGAAVRDGVEPLLARLREGTDKTRAELADTSMLVGIAFAVMAALVAFDPAGLIIGVILWRARPAVQKLTSCDDQLMGRAADLSGNLVAGAYAPIVLALFLMGRITIASAMASVLVALLWPPLQGRSWRRRVPVPAVV